MGDIRLMGEREMRTEEKDGYVQVEERMSNTKNGEHEVKHY